MNVVNDGCAVERTITVKVTKDNIDAGIPGSPNYCPIADALIEMGFDVPVVGRHCIRVRQGDDRLRGCVGIDVYAFIAHFDMHESVEPFEFTVTLRQDWTV